MEDVRLPELEVIQRYSIAVRQEYAPVQDVIAALRSDLDKLAKASRPARSRPKAAAKSRSTPRTKKATAKRRSR